MNRLSRRALAVLFVLASTLPLIAATKQEKIDALLTRYNQLRQFNGSALVAENGRVILKKGYGSANFEWQIPNTPDTRFRLGSITKQFTSMLIMQLVSEGKIKLGDKITTHLPDYRKETGDRVTIAHLLNHTSGIPSYTSKPGFRENVSRNPYTPSAFVKQFASGDLEFEPGSKYVYNNSGYFLLGAIIEKVTGKPYEKVVQERIFDPLGMKNSGYDHSATVIPKRASGYLVNGKEIRNAAYLDMSLPYSAGSLYSTVEDLYLWDRALYTDKLLPSALKKVMFTPGLENYAYGWLAREQKLDDEKTPSNQVFHAGGIDGFSTLLVREPEGQNLVVLLDNTSRGDRLSDISRGLFSILHGLEPKPARASIGETMMEVIEKGDVATAISRYRELKRSSPGEYDFSEPVLNRFGYTLLGQGRTADAIEVFKLNVEGYPAGANTYDSLAEAYMVSGNRELAITNYRKSLELDPKNTNAVDMLEKLEKPPTSGGRTIPLERLVGKYELAPGFVLAITKEGESLMGQATGQPRFATIRESDTEFSVVGVAARLTFVVSGEGPAGSLVLHQNGRDMPGKRIE